ncbi:MAG: cbb3-type cytochrome c oxidase subunit I [Gammaproteobacteria bacterium]|nr:cbb3-type cytochrome c oxidase subunit I [Gammaproteobacteria bacterium]
MIPANDFTIPVPDDKRKALVRAWLWLGLLALLGSGVFSILLVLSRTPHVHELIPWVNFFHTALVVHVDLSVLVWFLAFAGVLWSLNSTPRFILLGWAALALSALGTLIISLAPFLGAGNALMSNYIPVLQHPIFYVGLLIFASGMFLLVWRSMSAIPLVGQAMSGTGALRFGLNTTAVSAVMAIVAFAWTYFMIPDFVEGRAYFELLFWGGGHVLQFTYTLLLLVAWLWLASASNVNLPLTPRVTLIFFAIGLFAVFLTPLIYYSYSVTSVEHIKLFTWLMRYGGSLASLPLGLAVFYGLLISQKAQEANRPYRSALISSMILFGVGGLIGFFIQGTNVTIPAHYHGSIVGVTLALMGLTYVLLPQLGYSHPRLRMAYLQPYLYGGGQLLHVSGLVWSGGYGVQRKVAGTAQVLDGLEKQIAMGIMGLGGLIAIIGGVIFVFIVLEAMLAPKKT